MNRLKIIIDPEMKRLYGAEIHYTWRYLLSTIGLPWEEVEPGEACNIAYISNINQSTAPLTITANPESWARLNRLRLKASARENGLFLLNYGNGAVSESLITKVNGLVIQKDLILDTFWLLTGQEEKSWPQDRHGFYDLTGSALLEENLMREALSSEICTWLGNQLKNLGFMASSPRWPGGKKAAAAAGHDVDYPEVKRLIEPLRVINRLGLDGIKPGVELLTGRKTHWHFPDWLALEGRFDTRSAFYFTTRKGSLIEYANGRPDPFYNIRAPRFRHLFKDLREAGFEIGLHASYEAFQGREKFAAEKAALEEASGGPVIGNRHHYWHTNPDDVEETLLIHEEIGLQYDSSLIHDRYLGWRRGSCHPYFPFHQKLRREISTLQVPIGWMDDQLFRQHAHNPGDRDEALRDLADCAANQGGCLVIDIHDYVFDDELYPAWAVTYRKLWEYIIERGDFWLATPKEIADHWRRRYNNLLDSSVGLKEGIK